MPKRLILTTSCGFPPFSLLLSRPWQDMTKPPFSYAHKWPILAPSQYTFLLWPQIYSLKLNHKVLHFGMAKIISFFEMSCHIFFLSLCPYHWKKGSLESHLICFLAASTSWQALVLPLLLFSMTFLKMNPLYYLKRPFLLVPPTNERRVKCSYRGVRKQLCLPAINASNIPNQHSVFHQQVPRPCHGTNWNF